MADNLKPVGIQLVAQDATQFVEATQAASKAEADLVAQTKTVAASTEELQIITQKEYDTMQKMGLSTEYLNANFRIETTEVKANTQAVAENSQAQNGNAEATDKVAKSHGNNFTVMREGRLVMGAMLADMALMQLTAGETDKTIQEMGKSLTTVIDTGLLAFVATGNPVIAVAAGIAAGLLAIAQMASQADPDIVALDKDLESLGKKDDAIAGLVKLTGVTRDQAAAMLEVAKASPEAADALKKWADTKESLSITDQFFTILSGGVGILSHVNDGLINTERNVIDSVQPFKDLGNAINDAWNDLERFLGVAAGRGGDDQEKAYNNFLRIQTAANLDKKELQDLNATIAETSDILKTVSTDSSHFADLQVTDTDKIARANRDMNTSIARDARSLRDTLDQIGFSRVQAEENNTQAIAQANQAMYDSISNAARSLQNSLSDIEQGLRDKQTDNATKYANDLKTVNQSIAKDRQDLADKILDIENKKLADLAALDYDTGEKLRKATSENDKNEISLRAMYERGVIQQRATDQESQAQKSFDQQMTLENQKLDKIKSDAEQQKAIEERTAAEQIARAQRTYTQQVEDAKRRDQEQLANLAIRLQQEEEALNRQVANARKRYDEQVTDLRAHLTQEVEDTIAAEIAKAKSIVLEIQARMMNLALMQQTIAMDDLIRGTTGGNTGQPLNPLGNSGVVVGAANGMDAIVQSPTTIQVAEGYKPERVTVTPLSGAGSTSHSRTNNITVNIQSNNPDEVWNIFRTRLQQEVFRP